MKLKLPKTYKVVTYVEKEYTAKDKEEAMEKFLEDIEKNYPRHLKGAFFEENTEVMRSNKFQDFRQAYIILMEAWHEFCDETKTYLDKRLKKECNL